MVKVGLSLEEVSFLVEEETFIVGLEVDLEAEDLEVVALKEVQGRLLAILHLFLVPLNLVEDQVEVVLQVAFPS